MESLANKARNYFILGAIAEQLGMPSEAASNYFKALFAADDAKILEIARDVPKDHTERFSILKARMPTLYDITDRLFTLYRRTYTQDLDMSEVRLVKKRIVEAFGYAGIAVPGDEEIRKKVEELSRRKAAG
jgi:hypothetical protein